MTRPTCKNCKINLCEYNYKDKKTGKIRYRSLCKNCNPKFVWKQYKKNYCEQCGFIPEHQCQLDVDHIDGNHDNNLENNYQTLCANCHRLKTFNNKEHMKRAA